jgi:hypothetical protein
MHYVVILCGLAGGLGIGALSNLPNAAKEEAPKAVPSGVTVQQHLGQMHAEQVQPGLPAGMTQRGPCR